MPKNVGTLPQDAAKHRQMQKTGNMIATLTIRRAFQASFYFQHRLCLHRTDPKLGAGGEGMNRTSAFTLAILLALATSLTAKGPTTKITIRDSNSGGSVDITDPAILREFNVWAGPGTFLNEVEGTEGFIIDWSSGIITQRPTGLHRYEVSFHAISLNGADRASTYVVFYEHDGPSNQGYVYLPGKGDELYQPNSREIFRGHGFEGNWFLATNSWQRAIAPLISRQ
jgi:hypothetical protein